MAPNHTPPLQITPVPLPTNQKEGRQNDFEINFTLWRQAGKIGLSRRSAVLVEKILLLRLPLVWKTRAKCAVLVKVSPMVKRSKGDNFVNERPRNVAPPCLDAPYVVLVLLYLFLFAAHALKLSNPHSATKSLISFNLTLQTVNLLGFIMQAYYHICVFINDFRRAIRHFIPMETWLDTAD